MKVAHEATESRANAMTSSRSRGRHTQSPSKSGISSISIVALHCKVTELGIKWKNLLGAATGSRSCSCLYRSTLFPLNESAAALVLTELSIRNRPGHHSRIIFIT